jgi:hypothetical protein
MKKAYHLPRLALHHSRRKEEVLVGQEVDSDLADLAPYVGADLVVEQVLAVGVQDPVRPERLLLTLFHQTDCLVHVPPMAEVDVMVHPAKALRDATFDLGHLVPLTRDASA